MANKTNGDAFLNEYDNLGSLGEGGYARVVLARHREFGYVRALKIQDRMVDGEDDPLYLRFKEECGRLMRLGNGCHPNIVRMYKFGLFNNHAFAEMDYVDGCPLSEYMKDYKVSGLPWEEVWRFIEDIASALAYCHVDVYKYLMDREEDELESDPDDGSKLIVSEEKERELIQKYRVIHNDVHTNNVMRRHYDGHYVLLDFGLCIQNQAMAGVRSSQRKNGACEYVSPEKSSRILDGVNDANSIILPQEDVYSMGIMIYEAISGQPPFFMRNESDAERHRVYKGHLNVNAEELIDRLKEKRSDTPEWICGILKKCLQRNANDRYANAKELLEDFRLQSEEHEKEELDVIKKEYIKYIVEFVKLRKQFDQIDKGMMTNTAEINQINEDLNRISYENNRLKLENAKLKKIKAKGVVSVPVAQQEQGIQVRGLVMAMALLGNLLIAYKCYAFDQLLPSLLFLGLAGVATYMFSSPKIQDGLFFKMTSIVLLVIFLLVGVSVYQVLKPQNTDIVIYLAIGGVSLLVNVAMNFLKPFNKRRNEKSSRS